MVFGNRLIPTTLSVNIEEAHFVYSTKPAASRLDHFMHFIKCKAENFKVGTRWKIKNWSEILVLLKISPLRKTQKIILKF